MSLPTSNWGNIGSGFPVVSPNGADVYTTPPGPSTSVPGSANGPILGNYTILADGTAVQFLKALGAIALNAACRVSSWPNAYVVQPTSAINQECIAVNDRGLTVLSANYCTWFTRKGLAYPLTAAAVAAGAIVAPSSVSGTLYAATAGTDLQSNMVNTVVVGGAAAASPVLIS